MTMQQSTPDTSFIYILSMILLEGPIAEYRETFHGLFSGRSMILLEAPIAEYRETFMDFFQADRIYIYVL